MVIGQINQRGTRLREQVHFSLHKDIVAAAKPELLHFKVKWYLVKLTSKIKHITYFAHLWFVVCVYFLHGDHQYVFCLERFILSVAFLPYIAKPVYMIFQYNHFFCVFGYKLPKSPSRLPQPGQFAAIFSHKVLICDNIFF